MGRNSLIKKKNVFEFKRNVSVEDRIISIIFVVLYDRLTNSYN